MMNRIWIFSLLLSLLLCGCNDQVDVVVVNNQVQKPVSQPEHRPVLKNERPRKQEMRLFKMKKEKGWEHKLFVLNQGSRSQGWHGELFFGGNKILGVKKGENKITPLGRYVWNGRLEERANPWSSSGWMSIQKNDMRPLEFPQSKHPDFKKLDRDIEQQLRAAPRR